MPSFTPIAIISGFIFAGISLVLKVGISPPFGWFLIGLILCAVEYFLAKRVPHGYRFIALMMGASAIALAGILWRSASTLGIVWRTFMQEEGALGLQILYWIGLAFTSVIWIRPMFHRPKREVIPQSNEAETLTEIEPGKIGRVLYEGCSWQAKCENYERAIAPHQKVYVLRREGNILYIAPEEMFHL
jgi:membrane protein implicated in regulation of membrane protease activity